MEKPQPHCIYYLLMLATNSDAFFRRGRGDTTATPSFVVEVTRRIACALNGESFDWQKLPMIQHQHQHQHQVR